MHSSLKLKKAAIPIETATFLVPEGGSAIGGQARIYPPLAGSHGITSTFKIKKVTLL
jgi:hypothetical protein